MNFLGVSKLPASLFYTTKQGLFQYEHSKTVRLLSQLLSEQWAHNLYSMNYTHPH